VPHGRQRHQVLRNGARRSEEFEAVREYADAMVEPVEQDLCEGVDEYRVCPQHDERESPPDVASHLNQPVERQQHHDHPACEEAG